MITTRKSTSRTMIPFDYDKASGYLAWRMYIRQSVMDCTTSQDRLVLDAQRLLTKEARYTPYTIIDNRNKQVRGEGNVKLVLVIICALAVLIGGLSWA